MDLSNRKYKVVFVIDCSLADCSECDHCSEILLTAVRLLLLFRKASTKIKSFGKSKITHEKNSDSLYADVDIKWGFKLFSTTATLPRSTFEHTGFKSLKFCHIEEFEKKVKEVFDCLRNETAKRKSLSHPCELLSLALTDTLHDFTWSDEVFQSPVTRRRGQCKAESISRNIVFLLSKAPLSKKTLRRFSNKMVPDSEVFIDSFMSPALHKEYQQKMKISLHWVDFSSNKCRTSVNLAQNEITDEGVSILEDTCNILGGSFLSRDMILSQVPVLVGDAVESDTFLDPLYILRSFPVEARLSELHHVDHKKEASKIKAKITCHGFHEVPIILNPLKFIMRNRPIAVDSRPVCGESSFFLQSDKQDLHSICYFDAFDICDSHFKLHGCVSHNAVCDLLVHQFSSSYMLDTNNNDSMSSLLLQLATTHTLGILSVENRGRPLPTLAVLQGHMWGTGYIILLNCAASLHVEKSWLQENTNFIGHLNLHESTSTYSHSNGPTEKLENDLNKLQYLQRKNMGSMNDVKETQVFNSHCLNSWHVPGCTSQMSSVVAKLGERFDSTDNLSKTEKCILKQLQKLYAKEKQPKEIVENLQPSTRAPMCALRSKSVNSSGIISSSGGSESGSRSSQGGISQRFPSGLSRGRLMVDRARSASFIVPEDGNESSLSKHGSSERKKNEPVGLGELDIKTEGDLESYLQKQYDQVLSAGIAMQTTIQTMVAVTSRFMSNMKYTNPQQSTMNFIQGHLVMPSAKLKEKYMSQNTEESKRNKTSEYKLQVMLLLEMESLLKEANETRHELLTDLVSMLRALSFIDGATNLKDFLNDVIVKSYSLTLPKLLVDIFDELMLPVPLALSKFSSPSSPSSVWGMPMSVASEDSLFSVPHSSKPRSHLSDQSSQQIRSSKIKQHPSISDFRQTKQILIKPKLNRLKHKDETKKKTKEKVKTNTRLSGTTCGGQFERAKRNLFSVKAKTNHSKVKDKALISHKQKQKYKRSKTSGEKSHTLVLGTPVYKQTSQRHLQQQERRRRKQLDSIKIDVQVIAETPEKDNPVDQSASAMIKPARFIVREAFYSTNSQPSRNLARSLQHLQDREGPDSERYLVRSTKSQGTLASAVRGDSPILSPQSRLLKSFMFSPSPPPKSKAKDISTPLRRTPRKSAKKLLYQENCNTTLTQTNRFSGREDVHLVFDGENANDFSVFRSPMKAGTSEFDFKTPEKQKAPSQPDVWEALSCPPIIRTSM